MFKSFCGLSLQAGPIVICSEYFELNISQREFYWTKYIIPNFRALNGLKNANWPKIGSGSSAVGEERVTSPLKRMSRRLQIYEGRTTFSKRKGNFGPIGSTYKRGPNSDLKRSHVFGFSTE